MRALSLIAIALSATACGTNEPALPPRVAVLQPNYAQETLKQCSRASPNGVSAGWAIPTAIALQIETDLAKLDRQIPGGDPRNYYRQYVGIVQSGHRRVYINAFAPDTLEKGDNSWESVPTGACDGGDLFWGAVYDPSSHTFSELEFNGAI
jgi:hypothetical protein